MGAAEEKARERPSERGRRVSQVVIRQLDDDGTTVEDVADCPVFTDGVEFLQWASDCRTIDEWTARIDADPDDPEPWCARAQARLALGLHEGAAEDCDRALALRPGFASAYVVRAEAHLEMGLVGVALLDCERALKIDPCSVEAFRVRAGAWVEAGVVAAAVADLDAAVRVAPGEARLFLQRAELKLLVRDEEGATHDARVAVAMDAKLAGHLGPTLRAAMARRRRARVI